MSDKYPSESGRRRFVKGVVGSAALAGVGVTGAATIDLSTTASGAGGGVTPFVGIERVSGPAPRGMPYVPVEVDSEGYIRGRWPDAEEVTEAGITFTVAEEELGGQRYSTEWFQYCGRQNSPGVVPDEDQDNYFRSISGPDYEWQQEEMDEGDRLHIDHLDDYETWGNDVGNEGVGKPASCRWRSEGVDDGRLPVTVIRSSNVQEMIDQGGQVGEWFDAASEQNVIAWLNVCTHFCCIPGYKELRESAQFDGEDKVYCQCHQSVYDPFSPIFDTYVALPRPE
ncbi:MAG: Rieske 2Fe-2S domain-containing protein [Natronomonas sp.]